MRCVACAVVALMILAVPAAAGPVHAPSTRSAAVPQTPGYHNLFFQTTFNKQPLKLAYALFLPKDYATKPTRRAMVVFLCGAGEVGVDHQGVYIHGPAGCLQRNKDLADWADFIILSPQCPPGPRWDTPGMPQVVLDTIAFAMKSWRVDPDRVYLTGLSMGGTGTWHVAYAAKNVFAAIAPICGNAVEPDKMAARLAGCAAWIIVADNDGAYTDGSRLMYKRLTDARLTTYITEVPGAGHGVWGVYYPNRRFYEVLLLHKRNAPPPAYRPTKEELLAISRTPPNSMDTKLAGAFHQVFPWWTLINCGAEGAPGLKPLVNGKRNVFVTCPLNGQTPCLMQTSWTVPKTGRTALHLVVGHQTDGDWDLVVRADGKELLRKAVGKTTATNGWLDVRVDLTPSAGKSVLFELLNAPTGWHNESAAWAKVEFETQP